MSDDTLHRRLAALAGDAPGFSHGAQVLETDNAVAVMLEEIDTCVLPAALIFDRGDAELHLSVSGRKLHKVVAVTGEIEVPEDVVGAALAPEDETRLAAVGELFTAFAENAAQLHLRRAAASEDSTELSNRVSVAALSRAIGLRDPSDTRTPYERFAEDLDAIAKACILLEDGAVKGTKGAIAGISALKIALTTQLSQFLRTRESTCPAHTDPSLTLLADVVEPGQSMGVAVLGAHIALFTYDSADMYALQRAFRLAL